MTLEQEIAKVLRRYGTVPAPITNAVTLNEDDGMTLAARDLAERIHRAVDAGAAQGVESFRDYVIAQANNEGLVPRSDSPRTRSAKITAAYVAAFIGG